MKMAVRMMHQVQMMRSALFSASLVSSLAMDCFCSVCVTVSQDRGKVNRHLESVDNATMYLCKQAVFA